MVFVITENGRVFEERVPSSAYGESYYKFYRSEDDEPERISFFLSVRLGPENSD